MKEFIAFLKDILQKHKEFRYVIYGIALAISCFLVGMTGWEISENILTQFICLVIFVFIDLLGQYSLSMGKYYHSIARRSKYAFFAVFGLYVIFFSVPASVGFFANQMRTKDDIVIKSDIYKSWVNTRLDEISKSLDSDNAMMLTEAKTGYGSRASSLQSNINDLTTEQTNLINSLSVKPGKTDDPPPSYFQTLSVALWSLPAATIKVIMFTIAMIMLQFALIITCPIYKGDPEDKAELGLTLTEENDFDYIGNRLHLFSKWLKNLPVNGNIASLQSDNYMGKFDIPRTMSKRFRESLSNLVATDTSVNKSVVLDIEKNALNFKPDTIIAVIRKKMGK